MSEHPAIYAAEAQFDVQQMDMGLKEFFSTLGKEMYKAACVKGKFIGHVKIFGEGLQGTKIQVNVTGNLDNLRFKVRDEKPEQKMKVWINVIAYLVNEQLLYTKVQDVVRKTAAKFSVKIDQLSAKRHEQ